MRFTRYPLKLARREWTPRRLAAAKRAVAREAESVPLFPDLARFKSVAERQSQIDAAGLAFTVRMRKTIASHWRTARRQLRRLPPTTRAGILAIWNSGIYPADSGYLLSQLRKYSGPVSPWTYLRELHQYRAKWRKINAARDAAKAQAL